MSSCPCCSDVLLRHIRKGGVYWLCRSCWAEMPNFEASHRPLSTAPIKVKHTIVSIPQQTLIQRLGIKETIKTRAVTEQMREIDQSNKLELLY